MDEHYLAAVFRDEKTQAAAKHKIMAQFEKEVESIIDLQRERIVGEQPAFSVKSVNCQFLRLTLPRFLIGLEGFMRLIDCDGLMGNGG